MKRKLERNEDENCLGGFVGEETSQETQLIHQRPVVKFHRDFVSHNVFCSVSSSQAGGETACNAMNILSYLLLNQIIIMLFLTRVGRYVSKNKMSEQKRVYITTSHHVVL